MPYHEFWRNSRLETPQLFILWADNLDSCVNDTVDDVQASTAGDTKHVAHVVL